MRFLVLALAVACAPAKNAEPPAPPAAPAPECASDDECVSIDCCHTTATSCRPVKASGDPCSREDHDCKATKSTGPTHTCACRAGRCAGVPL